MRVKLLSFLLPVLLCISGTAKAETPKEGFTVGDFTFFLDYNYAIGYESFIGASVAASNKSIVIADIPETVEYNGVSYPVKAIHEKGFENCTQLTEVIMSDSVTFIESYAFSNCSALSKVVMSNSVTTIGMGAFRDCSSLTEIKLPDKLHTIGKYAFSGCGFKSITIPEELTFLGSCAFSDCNNLTDVYFNAISCHEGNYASIPEDFPLSVKNLVFGDKVRAIHSDYFRQLDLETLVIPESVESIGGYGDFWGCCNGNTKVEYNAVDCRTTPRSASEFILGPNVKRVPDLSKTSISQITIPESAAIIPDGAFEIYTLRSVTYNAINCQYGEYAGRTPGTCFNSHLSELIIGDKVETIPWHIFKETSINSVSIPASVKQIGEHAFDQCQYLKEVYSPSLEAWMGIRFADECSTPLYNSAMLTIGNNLLRRLTIPEGTSVINDFAFLGCSSLLSVTFPKGLKSIGKYAFSKCESLQRLDFPSLEDYLYLVSCAELTPSLVYLADKPLAEESVLTIPEGYSYIPDNAFKDLTQLTTVILPSTIRTIGAEVFSGCRQLSDINLGEGLRSIGSGAFQKTALSSVVLPSAITEINDYVFSHCSSITSFKILGPITSIGNDAFSYCTMLPEFEIPATVTTIGYNAFRKCSHLTEIEIPTSVKLIGYDAFLDCIGLKNLNINDIAAWCDITFENSKSNPMFYTRSFTINCQEVHRLKIPDEVSYVNSYAFFNVTNLTTVDAGNANLGISSFSRCENLEKVLLNCEKIDQYAFHKSEAIKEVYCNRTTPPIAPDDTFSKYSGVTLYVPQGCREAYENASTCWWNFLDCREYDFSDVDKIFAPDYSAISSIELNAGKLSVNAVGGELSVSGIDGGEAVAIHNISGQMIYNGRADGNIHLAPGFYVINTSTEALKFVVK